MSEIPVRFLVTIHALWTVPTLLLLFKLVNSPYVFCWLLLNNNTSVSWGAFLNWWGVLKLFTMKRIQWSSTTVVFLRLPGRFSFLPNTPVCSFHLGMKGQVLRALDYICCRSSNPITSGVFFPPFSFFSFYSWERAQSVFRLNHSVAVTDSHLPQLFHTVIKHGTPSDTIMCM